VGTFSAHDQLSHDWSLWSCGFGLVATSVGGKTKVANQAIAWQLTGVNMGAWQYMAILWWWSWEILGYIELSSVSIIHNAWAWASSCPIHHRTLHSIRNDTSLDADIALLSLGTVTSTVTIVSTDTSLILRHVLMLLPLYGKRLASSWRQRVLVLDQKIPCSQNQIPLPVLA
jgi:hypothetical protein